MKKLFIYLILTAVLAGILEGKSDQPLYDENPLPVIRIETIGHAEILSRQKYVTCTVDVLNCADSYAISNAAGEIKVRGNSSAHFGDTDMIRAYGAPYRIRFDQKLNLLGLNNEAMCKSWVLLQTGPWLLCDEIAFRMGRTILDEEQFCSDSMFVRVYINGKFCGLYLLCEQSQVNESRINIHEPRGNETDVFTGYFMEIDNYAVEEPDSLYFKMQYANGIATDIHGITRSFRPTNYSIKSEIAAQEQADFIDCRMNGIFTALYEACVNDRYLTIDDHNALIESNFTTAQQVADELLDLESVVNMYILYEIVHDYDVGDGSFYMVLDLSEDSVNRKLQFTCPWDFAWAYEDEPEGRYYAGAFCSQEFMDRYHDRSNPWFVLLMKEDWFVNMVKERWTQLRRSGDLQACLSADRSFLQSYADVLNGMEEGCVQNAGDVLDWLECRMNWLDSEWLIATP